MSTKNQDGKDCSKKDSTKDVDDWPVGILNIIAVLYIIPYCITLNKFTNENLIPHLYVIAVLLMPFFILYFLAQRYYVRKMELKVKMAMLEAHQQAANDTLDKVAQHLTTLADKKVSEDIQKEFMQLAIRAHASPLTGNSSISLFTSSKK